MTSPNAPAIGDQVLIASYLINTRVYGYVVPASSQQEFTATYEISGDQGTMTIAAVIGSQGQAGANMFVLNLQTDATDAPANLPQTLTNTVADVGKTWLFDDIDSNGDVIGSSAYVWYGTAYRRMMLGQPGPPGPVPIITPAVNLIPYPGTSDVVEGGTPYEPTLTFNLAVPPGPTGPAGALATCPDVDFVTNAPVPGDVLGTVGGTYTTQLTTPSTLVSFGSSAGGSLAAGTYYWVITATSGPPFGTAGETSASNEVTAIVAGTHSSVLLEWLPVQSAAGYNIYRTTVNGSTGTENRLITTVSGSTTSYLDTGTAGTSQSPPGSNNTVMNFPLWVPVSISQLLPSPFSMPTSAFTAYSGLSAQAPIGSFAIPPQPFPWTPVVWGHIGVKGFALTGLGGILSDIFGGQSSGSFVLIGCEVLLGNSTNGTMVGRGFGNVNAEVNIMPHYSTARAPGMAITPNNDQAVVPANHSNPAEGTLYVNLYNDGKLGLYHFNPVDAQIFVMIVPVTE